MPDRGGQVDDDVVVVEMAVAVVAAPEDASLLGDRYAAVHPPVDSVGGRDGQQQMLTPFTFGAEISHLACPFDMALIAANMRAGAVCNARHRARKALTGVGIGEEVEAAQDFLPRLGDHVIVGGLLPEGAPGG